MRIWLAGLLLGSGSPLDALDASLKQPYLQSHYRYATLQHELLGLLEYCGQRAIPCVPLKGIWLAERVLPVPAMRQFADIDVWVAEGDVDPLLAFNRGRGYQDLPGASRRRRWHFHVSQFKLVGGLPVVIEIHWKLSRGRLETVDWQEPWGRIRKFEYSGVAAWEMEPLDQAFYLYYHGANHMFEDTKRLLDLCAVDAWLHQQVADPWPRIQELARRGRTENFIQLSRTLIAVLMGKRAVSDLPGKWRRYVRFILAAALQNPPVPRPYCRRILKFFLTDSPFQALRTLFSPSRLILKHGPASTAKRADGAGGDSQ